MSVFIKKKKKREKYDSQCVLCKVTFQSIYFWALCKFSSALTNFSDWQQRLTSNVLMVKKNYFLGNKIEIIGQPGVLCFSVKYHEILN